MRAKAVRGDDKPNIVLIVLDAVRQDHLSCYGYSRATTPHIDRLAAEGVLFENAYSTSCWTIPSHASLFTGLYPSQHGVSLEHRTFHTQHQTLAEFLDGQGYETACISCNSFVAGGGTDLNRGFGLTVDVDSARYSGPGVVQRVLRAAHKRWRAITRRDRGAERATQMARDWLYQQPGPFFLFMNYMDCHLPYRLRHPQRYQFIPPMERKRVDRIPLDPFAAMAGKLQLTPRDCAGIRALYDGSLYYLDQQIGILVDTLKELGVFEQTILLITSDHGESFGEHGLFDHQYGLYEHLLRVPLVAHFPEGGPRGARVTQPIQHVDLFPLIRDRLNGEMALPRREVVFAEYLAPNLNAIHRRFPSVSTRHLEHRLRAVIAGGIKLIWHDNGGSFASGGIYATQASELYDLTRDPGETTDLSAARPEKVSELQALITAKLGSWPGSEDTTGQPDLDDDLRERLEAMGYL